MKAIVIILVVLGLGLGLVYFYGGYESFDPAQKGKDARAAIQPGMSWEKVIEIAGESPKFCYINRQVDMVGGTPTETLKPSSPSPFERKRLERHLANNELKDGFILQYKFTETVAFEVVFDDTGTVTGVQNMMTIADLLGTKE